MEKNTLLQLTLSTQVCRQVFCDASITVCCCCLGGGGGGGVGGMVSPTNSPFNSCVLSELALDRK